MDPIRLPPSKENQPRSITSSLTPAVLLLPVRRNRRRGWRWVRSAGTGRGRGERRRRTVGGPVVMNSLSPSVGADGRHDDDAALTDFLASLMDYTPTIPDELVEHYLARSGLYCPDIRLTRLISVATQKFVADVASDALQHCKARQAAPVKDKSKQPKDKRLVLTMDDLSKSLQEYGVNLKHQEYFADSPSSGMDPKSREE